MPNTYFRFRQFTVHQEKTAMKVCTDACLFGAWIAHEIGNEKIEKVLDIGAGTGLLSLMIAQGNGAQIDAVEIDDHAYAQAVENLAASPWSGRMRVHHCAIQEFEPGYHYDLVISNPPFYEQSLRSPDSKKNLAMHSTRLDAIELFAVTKRLMAKGGRMALLIPYNRVDAIERIIKDNALYVEKKVLVKQTEKHSPFRCMYMLRDVFSGFEERKITVRDEEFSELLKGYYL
jgi:tRNA1Val (adenine37-N6)-methyltransferase